MSARGTAEILVAIILVPAAAGAGEPVALPAGPPALLLTWLDVSGVTGGVDGVARSEVRSILSEAGLEVAWRRGRGGEEARPGEIQIILVDRLRVDRVSGRPVLGATPSRLREHPFVWIHVRSVRAALGLAGGSSAHDLPVGARRNLGVALGRVIAHEVVHALAPALRHGRALMSESLKWDHLTGPRLSVEPEVALSVRTALQGLAGPTALDAGVLAAEGPSPGATSPVPTQSAEQGGRTRLEPGRDLAR